MLFQRWYLVKNESWAGVHLSALFQRWQNNVETTSIELRRFNFDGPMLFQRWNLAENESSADVCLSTLTKQRWNNIEIITSINQCSFKVDSWLKMKVESTYVDQRCFEVEETALKQIC